MGRDRDAPAYLWAEHPAIAGCSVHPVHAVSARATPSRPSRRRAARSAAPTTPFTTMPGTQKALSPLGKGPDLRKLVAGGGFGTSDVWVMSRTTRDSAVSEGL